MDPRFRLRSHGTASEFQLVPAQASIPLNTREAALGFLLGFLPESSAVTDLRGILARQRGDVSQLTDQQVLLELATLLVSGRYVAIRTGPDNRVFGAGVKAEEEVEARAPMARSDEPEEEAYVLVAEVKTIGGTLLLDHPVRVLDPDTGAAVIERINTDEQGVVRTLVPRNKTYRIEILDEEWEAPTAQFLGDHGCGMLLCRFVDESGQPLANLGVEARQDDQEFQLITDADGWIESPANLGAYELRVGDQVFVAHAMLPEDVTPQEAETAQGDAPTHYRFVVTGATAEVAADDQGEEHTHRLDRAHDLLVAGDAGADALHEVAA